MKPEGFIEPVKWHASLPGVVVSAAALIGDGAGGVLIVKPNYRDHWTLPGGICEFGEAPRAGCAREVTEELGIEPALGALLAVDWQLAQDIYGPTARPAVFFIFDGGILPSLSGIQLQPEELDDCQFAATSDLESLLAPASSPRVVAALTALPSGCVRTGPGLAAL
ncbi:MAG TPA: NUDIX hydrolase [Streptosporangiaceae bacterium]|nr:NUDIX hydrolase [Streptosporangiaceae bacterium]